MGEEAQHAVAMSIHIRCSWKSLHQVQRQYRATTTSYNVRLGYGQKIVSMSNFTLWKASGILLIEKVWG